MKEHPYLKLAREAIRTYLETSEICSLPAPLSEEMERHAGTFVSLKKREELRGCIGTYLPSQKNIAEEIIHNAISAATRDPRFPPVTLQELDNLEISVDVLGPPTPVKALNELDPRQYGIIVEHEGRRGLLLPDLEGVDTVEQQIEIARKKAGIGADDPVEIRKFEVVRYKQRSR
ncbi:MAG: AmmeMemoRadiSam system protein A [Candidatus Tectomicrobia bacterium]|uniref:AmmeMemoRadiSam system protein A n=1 Tax=Tectimicrobiota bacterium TaxID=2528274 RepID=A0A932LYI6_UNCTE|nr:AmmeMemoRadiSam system protein A [Candidatus Tectomicrobia bacterium]